MGVLSRMSTVVKSKMNRILDNAEDPRETLDFAYEKQMEMLKKVKRGVVEMVTTKRRIEQQASKVRENILMLDKQASQALNADREDLARVALQRKQASLIELEGLDEQISNLELEQQKLTQSEQRLQAKVQAFRTKKEITKAQYNAAQAQVKIGAALSGLSEEMGDVSIAIERAESKTENMRAKAGAIDELAEAGVLDDFSGRDDPVGSELAQLTADQNVEDELATHRNSLTSGEYLDELNTIDNQIVDLVAKNSRSEFGSMIASMLNLVREKGTPVPIDEMVESDIVLPEPDITLDEAAELFTGEGIVPD